jgi:LCP family protein required for cell wall assembly
MSKDRYDIYDDEDMEECTYRRRSSRSSSGKQPKKRRSLKAQFFIMLASILAVYCIGVMAYFAWTYFNADVDENGIITASDPIKALTGWTKPNLPERTNFIIAGTDEDGTRTDTIMLGCYNSTLEELSLISIPRDTLVEVSDEMYRKMRAEFPEPGQKGMKINAIYHYGGENNGMNFLKEYLEELYDIEIDNYVVVNFEGFDYLIDSIGGIEYDVPIDMDYDDPAQDLAIHLKKGVQQLNGKQAEGLVRFRKGYSNQDLGRIETQQNFMKVLMKKIVNADTIFSNPTAYMTTFFKYLKTDVTIADAVKYLAVVKDFNPSNVYVYTLPGDIGSNYGIKGGYVYYEDETAEQAYQIFKKPSSEIYEERKAQQSAAETGDTIDDHDLTIQVLNGGYTNGMASYIQKKLTFNEYNVVSIGTWNEAKSQKTRIYVKEDGMGQDLKECFSDAEVITDAEMTKDYDVVIVIGMGELSE